MCLSGQNTFLHFLFLVNNQSSLDDTKAIPWWRSRKWMCICLFHYLDRHHRKAIRTGILIHSSCYHITPWIGWLIKNKNVFIIVLKAGKSMIKVLKDWVCQEPISWFIDGCFSLYSHMVERGGDLSGASFIREAIPFMKTPPLWPNHMPKAPPPSTITLGIVSTYEFGEGNRTDVQSIAEQEWLSIVWEEEAKVSVFCSPCLSWYSFSGLKKRRSRLWHELKASSLK